MAEGLSPESEELRQAFVESERKVAIQNYKVGCILGIIFMPAGVALDWFVYRDEVPLFLALRLLCSFLLSCLWLVLRMPWGAKHYRALGMIEVSLPLFFISWMIYEKDGGASPYYAGLNLVIMGAGMVLRWSLQDSVFVLVTALAMYLSACLLRGPIGPWNIFFNNIYFLIVTGVFVVTGNYFYNRIRFSEFRLRFELDRSSRMLEESNRKLVEMDEIKTRFFANISHELRTPLTLLLAPLEALLQQKGRITDPEALEWLRTMQANGMRLLKLINDLLDLVKLDSQKMDLRRDALDMEQFLRGLAQSVQKVADDKRLTLTVSVSSEVGVAILDRDKLEKIVLNLVFNSVKFTPAGGRITMGARLEEGELLVTVEDTGMGISESALPYVFDRFWQADGSSSRKSQGTGIGLALVQELVQAQKGRVEVHSQVGRGTRMVIHLPYEAAPDGAVSRSTEDEGTSVANGAPASAASVGGDQWLSQLYRRAELFPAMTSLQESMRPVEVFHDGSRSTVLVADDEPDMLRFLKSQLSENFQVLEAVDGRQALEKASQFLPDIILLDMMMPEMDGLEVCRELRQRTPTRNIPVVLLTARADEETKLASLQAGANDFLSKPFSSTELHVRLRNLVESHHFQRKLARQNQILEATLEQLKETETQLVQSEKLAALGRLSAGIIHEINNPLNYARTGIYTLKSKGRLMEPDEKADFEDVLKDVEEGIDRVKTIVSDLRTFTHPNSGQLDTVNVHDLVTKALRFVSHEWRDKVSMSQNIDPDLNIDANFNQVIQVLVNLLQNSLDAIRRKKFPEGEKPEVTIQARQENDRKLIVIRDNGEGIAAEHLGKVFDPFFTTKDVGEGMGLGLSICYRIIEQHGGRIRVASERGKFCEFTLDFPAKMRQLVN